MGTQTQCQNLWHGLVFFYLIRCPPMDDGLDEDTQIFSGLFGLVAFQADAQPRGARLIEGDLVHQLLPAVLQQHTVGFLTFLGGKK